MSEPLGKVSAMGDERRRILLTGEPRGHKEDKAMDREKMLDVTLQQIEKQFGKGAVMKLGEHPMGAGITVIPTGSLALDIALGVGGIPRGRIIEVFGPEGSGKTTVCLHMIAEAQAKGGIAAFIDAEHALDPTYARELGVNIDELLVSQPDSGEQALEIADMLVRSAALDIVVVDSVAALVPRAEIEGEMGDTHVGLQARLMSQAMRKLAGTLSRFDTSAIFINQLREKIGVMFGSPETTPGGRALKFYSSVRLDVRKIENLKDGTDVVGSRTRVKVVKNKVAPPFRQCEFDIMYGKGISKEGSLIDVGVEQEIIKKAGAWFTYEGDQLGQGRENAKQFLAEHTDVRDEIDRKVREAVGLTELRHRGRGDAHPGRSRPRPRGPAARARARAGIGRGRQTVEGAQRQRLARRWTARPHASPKPPKSCHERALGLLAVRARSRRELERRLLQAGFEPDEVADVLERLERVGLIDDEAFARQVAEHAFGVKRSGRRAVVSSLMAAGVAPDLIEATLADAGDEEARAEALARSRASRLGSLDPVKAFSRLTSLLVRRGYSPEMARQAARRALALDASEATEDGGNLASGFTRP